MLDCVPYFFLSSGNPSVMTNAQLLAIKEAIKNGALNDIERFLSEHTNWASVHLTEDKLSMIHYASKYGSLNTVKLLLKRRPDLLNSKDIFNRTPICFAVVYNHLNLVKYLANCGADLTIAVNNPTHPTHGYRPVHWAAFKGRLAILQCLIEHRADINVLVGADEYHLIHIASIQGHVEVVLFLLDKNPNLLNITDAYNQTPVIWAACEGHVTLVRRLAILHADLTVATNTPKDETHGYRPIHWAFARKRFDVARCLIKEHRVSISTRVGAMQYHLIHIASLNGEPEGVQILLDKDPTLLNVKDANGQTPVLLAAIKNHFALVKYLVEQRADLTIATDCPNHEKNGYLPIHWAAAEGHYAIVEYFISCGVNPSKRVGAMQYHLIHIASIEGHLEIVRILLKHYPKLLNIRDAYGRTPLFLAAAYDHAHVVEYLITENANLELAVNRPNHPEHGQTPLSRAMESRHYEVVNLIILKMAADQNKEWILPYVQSGIQALGLMVSSPDLINVFLQDSRIANLVVKKTNCNITNQYINWYRPRSRGHERRPSMFARIGRNDGAVAIFKPVRELGAGAYGLVRLFKRTDGQEEIAVKSIRCNVVVDDCSRLTRELNREVAFNQRAYPDNFSELFEFMTRENDRLNYINYHLMPYVKGETVDLLIPKSTCLHQLANMILKIAQEVDRIHGVGIIHGDLNPRNIMIHCGENGAVVVRLIDFGLSCDITEKRRGLWPKTEMGKCAAPELAIDGTADQVVKPHPNQDVYTLGYSLNYVLRRNPLYHDVIHAFPSIERFILASQKTNPIERPVLGAFCKQLSNELSGKTVRASIKENILNMTSALVTFSWFKGANQNTDRSPAPPKNRYCAVM